MLNSFSFRLILFYVYILARKFELFETLTYVYVRAKNDNSSRWWVVSVLYVEETGLPGETTNLLKFTDKLYHINVTVCVHFTEGIDADTRQ